MATLIEHPKTAMERVLKLVAEEGVLISLEPGMYATHPVKMRVCKRGKARFFETQRILADYEAEHFEDYAEHMLPGVIAKLNNFIYENGEEIGL